MHRESQGHSPLSHSEQPMSVTTGSAAVRNALCPDGQCDELERKATMILSAMQAAEERSAPHSGSERRRAPRHPYQARAQLLLAADGPDAEPWILFIRDADERAMGFITPDRLPLGSPGTLSFTSPRGRSMTVNVSLSRCRSCAGGWYEGALQFSRPQAWLLRELA
jgi:hypothetical protein